MKNKRINIKSILCDKVLRKELMISTIQAIQAREGIDTTFEQASQAYNKVMKERLNAKK